MKSVCGDGAGTQAMSCHRLMERAGRVAWAYNRTYVQNPPQLEFSAAELVWSKVEGWRDNIDRVALIPFARVDDFVRGESSSKDCPTRFHVEARRKRPPESAYKPKVDGILEYILYWCSFGPDDHRKGGVVRPSRSTYTPKKNNAGRPNSKRGCTCHFIVKRLIAKPTVALIIYNQDKHVDKKGMPCHGPQDKKAAGTHAMFAPTISEELRLRVLSLLYVGVSVETIMQRHNESVEKQGGPFNRDDLLTHRYVRRQERSIRRASFELDEDDFVSVGMWVESHQSSVFFYKEFSDASPFILGIQTEWQLQQMIHYGNRGLLALNSRFGTHKLKYPVQSLLVFNTENKAIAVAWILAPTCSNHDTDRWMRALYNRVRTKDPSWKLAGFIVDDPSGDFLSIRDVFQCSLLLCFWRVRHALQKNLVKRCPEVEMCSELSRWLGNAVDNIRRGKATANLFDGFMHDFVEARDFMDYFKAVWIPRIGAWTAALKNFPLASQETSAAMEFYQKQLKLRLLNESDTSVYKRADWLVDKLGTEVHAYFWLDEYSEKADFARYQKDEWASGFTAWQRALKIPDSGVIVDGKCVKVCSPMNQDKIHIVWNPGSEFAICDCYWAEKGYLCEHILKVIKYYREKGLASPSFGLNQFRQALNGILRCHLHDSLIRDQATSLSALLKEQLTELISVESEDAIPKSVGLPNAENINIMSLKTSCSLKDLASSDGYGCKESSGEREVNLDGHGGLISEEQCNKMEVDSSVCVSKSLLDNGAPSKDINCKSGQEVVDSALICPASGEMNVKDTTTKDMSFQNADRNLGSNITDLSNGPALPGDAVAV